jgi:predicted flap endonuclease-1-like 5' DNA nuclease
MASRWTGFALLLFLIGTGFSAQASHYPLEVVPFLEAGHRAKFSALKLEDTEQLLNALLTDKARQGVAGKTGIDEVKLLDYARTCDLLRIRGIGPKLAKLLLLSGVTGVAALRAEKPAELLVSIRAANKQHGVSEILPQEETLKEWIHQARALDLIVK